MSTEMTQNTMIVTRDCRCSCSRMHGHLTHCDVSLAAHRDWSSLTPPPHRRHYYWLRSESTNHIDLYRLDLDRFVRRDRFSPMKMNAFVSLNAIFTARCHAERGYATVSLQLGLH